MVNTEILADANTVRQARKAAIKRWKPYERNARHQTLSSSSNMTNNADTAPDDLCRLISPEKVYHYGVNTLKAVAANHPNATFGAPPHGVFLLRDLPHRRFDVCLDPKFSRCWHDQLEKDFLEILIASFATNVEWSLNVIRSGFDKDSSKNPITLLIAIKPGDQQDLDGLHVLRTLRLLHGRLKHFWPTEG